MKTANSSTVRVRKLWYRLGLLSFMTGLIAVFGQACSTPAVPTVDPDPPESAWYAYQQCLNTLPRNANTSACDNVGATNVQSSYYYTQTADTTSLGYLPTYTSSGALIGGGFNAGTSSIGTTSSGYRYKATRGPAQADDLRAQLDMAYHEYLKTADEASLREMTAQWLALAASGNH